MNSQVKVKPPKLELKPFDGDIINWKPFWDQLNASIHSNNLISKIEKLSYLKTFLNNSAWSCISGLTLKTENCDEAIKILEKRFGNKQIFISAFMQQFVSLPKIKSANDKSGLRKLFVKVENRVRNFENSFCWSWHLWIFISNINKRKIVKWFKTFNCVAYSILICGHCQKC